MLCLQFYSTLFYRDQYIQALVALKMQQIPKSEGIIHVQWLKQRCNVAIGWTEKKSWMILLFKKIKSIILFLLNKSRVIFLKIKNQEVVTNFINKYILQA